ncbi:MAG: hypothetical protein EXS14_02600, partial [Planctomycetes bacterium]|nr:hypothetical protein [Planctomycetota bacterium]
MANKPPPTKKDDSTKTVLYIAGAILSVGLALWTLSSLFSRNEAQVEQAQQEEVERKARDAAEVARKKREYEAFVAKTPLAPRPIRLFHEFVAAIALDNKAE